MRNYWEHVEEHSEDLWETCKELIEKLMGEH